MDSYRDEEPIHLNPEEIVRKKLDILRKEWLPKLIQKLELLQSDNHRKNIEIEELESNLGTRLKRLNDSKSYYEEVKDKLNSRH